MTEAPPVLPFSSSLFQWHLLIFFWFRQLWDLTLACLKDTRCSFVTESFTWPSWYHRMPSKRKLRSHLIVFITRESFFNMTNHRKGKYKQHSKIFPQFWILWLLSNAPTPERVKTLFWVVGNKVIFVILLHLCNGGLPYATWKCRQMTVNNCRTLHSDIEHLYPLVKGRAKAYPLKGGKQEGLVHSIERLFLIKCKNGFGNLQCHIKSTFFWRGSPLPDALISYRCGSTYSALSNRPCMENI